jgi:hypothetical protein
MIRYPLFMRYTQRTYYKGGTFASENSLSISRQPVEQKKIEAPVNVGA